jgi:protein-S-isoprenylcysteine O-methyltransferase Ste14
MRADEAAGAAVPSAVIRFGALAYRTRQYLSMALLAVSIYMARPLTASPAANTLLHACAFALVICGGALRSWAMGHHTWRRVHGEGSQRRLITAGPYALVRNPLYLGTLLISGGIALMSGSWAVIGVYLVVFWAGYAAIILWEESRLDRQFGDRYRSYFQFVPRLIPNGTIWSPREGEFSASTMMRCMEPAKTVAFLAALGAMLYLKG